MTKKVANVLVVIGVIIIIGAMGYDDIMTISGKFYPFDLTIRHMIFGAFCCVPRLVYGKKFA